MELRALTSLTDRARTALAGRYAVEREIGRGGMATVLLARDLKHDRAVAVKVMHTDFSEALGEERFLREVRITARLSHPHILPLLDSGASDGLLYYVMPFVEGESLRARLAREGQLPVADALRIAREVADALGYAHGRGIIHRDVKPENILLESDHALVADFGIARAMDEAKAERLTATGLAMGTPLYMSPEQAQGEATIDGRSDIHSLGSVLYEMLVGEPPHRGPTAQAVITRKLTESAPPIRSRRPSVPAAVETALARALAPTPADRFRTAADFAAALVDGPAATTAPSRPATRTFIAAAVLLLVAAAGWFAWSASNGSAGASEPLRSIAVLPFANLNDDSTHDYFSDGLTDELITSLSAVDSLRVASRTSSFAFRAGNMDIREIGRRLGVKSVLEGTVRREDRRVRVTARLVGVDDGYQRWSRTYERNADDALRIQQEIAASIVTTLQGGGDAVGRPREDVGAPDPEAYDLYLRARFFRNKRDEAGLRRSVTLFNEVVERAPGFARAHVGLADSHVVLGFYVLDPPSEAFPIAVRHAREALRLDPTLGSAHATLGYVELYHEWDFPRAEQEFRRAIELEPSHLSSRQWYANFLVATGRFEEAKREIQQVIALDPLSIVANAVEGWVLYHAGEYEAAERQFVATLELDSTLGLTHLWRGQTLEAMGRLDEATESLRRGARLTGDQPIYVAALARTLALRGERAEAERRLVELGRVRVVPSFEIAKVHAALGRRPEALRWLERAYDERSHSMALLRADPQLADLRDEPRFRALLARLKL